MGTVAAPQTIDPIIERLEDQISYYDAKSSRCQKSYKGIKLVEIISAALIPFLAALHVADTHDYVKAAFAIATALLGVLITILEGVLQLQQYQQIWVTYRATCEALKHEKYTYLARADPYKDAPDPHVMLAERIESLISQEHSKWASVQQKEFPVKTGEDKGKPPA